MGNGPQPGGTDDRVAGVVGLVAESGVAGVYGDPDLEGRNRRPGLGLEAPLGIERSVHRVGRPGEGGDDAVALALLDRPHPAVGGHHRVEQLVVAGDGDGHRRPPPPSAGWTSRHR